MFNSTVSLCVTPESPSLEAVETDSPGEVGHRIPECLEWLVGNESVLLVRNHARECRRGSLDVCSVHSLDPGNHHGDGLLGGEVAQADVRRDISHSLIVHRSDGTGASGGVHAWEAEEACLVAQDGLQDAAAAVFDEDCDANTLAHASDFLEVQSEEQLTPQERGDRRAQSTQSEDRGFTCNEVLEQLFRELPEQLGVVEDVRGGNQVVQVVHVVLCDVVREDSTKLESNGLDAAVLFGDECDCEELRCRTRSREVVAHVQYLQQ